MKGWILTILLLASGLAMQGQVISGHVTDVRGKGIRGVVCKLKTANDSTLSYSFTDNSGQYSMPVKQDAWKIEFSHLSYEKETRELAPDVNIYDVTLYTKSNKLKEVKVTVAPIRRNNDTLTYNAASFKKQEDEYVADVLRRLPGIDVSAAGEITYQGKSINKLNIEGLDLMGDKYNQAIQNMPAEAVSQIQLMENNQPIRALAGTVNNNHATLNIKLNKKYKLRPFGEIEGGGGDDVWAGSSTLIQMNKKNQWLVTGTLDNRGISLSSLTQEMANYDRLYTHEPLPQPLLVNEAYTTPPISPIYYLKNKSYFAGINYLHAFSQYSALRVNVLFNHEDADRVDSTFNKYFATDTISLHQHEVLFSRANTLKAQARYELNSEKFYLEDILTGESSWVNSDATYRTESADIWQTTKGKPAFIQNILNTHVRAGSHIYTFSSVIRAFECKENLYFLFSGDEPERQDTRQRSFFSRQRIGSTFNLWGNTLSLSYILEHKDNQLKNKTVNKSHYWLQTIEPSYSINFAKGDALINLPVEYISYCIFGKDFKRVLFSPSLDLNIKYSPALTGEVEIGYNQEPNTQDLLYKGLAFSNYRNYSIGLDSMSVHNTAKANLSLSYLNTTNLLSMNMLVGWQHEKRDFLPQYLYTDVFTLFQPKWEDNNATTLSAAFSVKKIFRAVGISVKYSAQYADNRQTICQNDLEGKIRYHTFSTTLKTEWSHLSYLHVTGAVGSNMHWKQRDGFSNDHNFLKDYEYNIKVDVFPTNRLHAYADFSQIFHEIAHGSYAQASFINTGVKYRAWKNASLKFSIVNLLNMKSYKESAYNGVNYSYYEIPLRGRELMLSLNLKI